MTTTNKPTPAHFFRKVVAAIDTCSVMHCNDKVMLYVQMTHVDTGSGAHLTVTEARTLAAHLLAAADALAPVCRLGAVQHKYSVAHVLIDADGRCLADLPDDWSDAWDAADAWATANGYRFDYAARVSAPAMRYLGGADRYVECVGDAEADRLA
jgi:hypothetical protein